MTHRMKTPTQNPRPRVKSGDFVHAQFAYPAMRYSVAMSLACRAIEMLPKKIAIEIIRGWMRESALNAVHYARNEARRREFAARRDAA